MTVKRTDFFKQKSNNKKKTGTKREKSKDSVKKTKKIYKYIRTFQCFQSDFVNVFFSVNNTISEKKITVKNKHHLVENIIAYSF